SLGAIAALQQEGLPALRRGEALPQGVDLPGNDDRRQPRQVRHHPLEGRRMVIDGLLLGGPGLPARAMPGGCLGGSHGGWILPCAARPSSIGGNRRDDFRETPRFSPRARERPWPAIMCRFW